MAKGPLIDWAQHHDTVVKLAPTLNPKRIADRLGLRRNTVQAYMQRNRIKAATASSCAHCGPKVYPCLISQRNSRSAATTSTTF